MMIVRHIKNRRNLVAKNFTFIISVISKTPVKRKPKISEKALIKRLEAKLFKVCETLNKSGNSTNVPEYRRLIRKLNLISSQISSIKSIFNDGLKKSKMKSFKTKKRHLQNLQKSKVKTKPKSSVLCPKEGEKETNESEGEKKRGFVNLLSSTFPKNIIVDCLNKREEPEKGEISILKAVEQERISSAKDNNSKLVLSSRKINGDHSSVSSDKKFIIIRRGKNNKWSIRKLTILQAIKVFGQESNEKK